MYLWDISHLVDDLKNNRYSNHEIRMYYILSPLLSLANGAFFGALLFGHHIVEYSFKDWLKKPHQHINFYNYWAAGLTAATIIIAFGGMYLCYRANKKGDGKDFWPRMACLSFPINFHITVYSLAALGLFFAFGYFFLQDKIAIFKKSIWPPDQTVSDAINKAAQNPLVEVAIKTVKQKQGVLGKVLSAPVKLVAAPLIPLRIKAFLKDLRALILMYYPTLSLLPCFLSLLHYLILRRMIKKVAEASD